MLCSRSASLITSTRMSRLIATTILRIVSACAESPYLTLSSLVTPSTSSATSSPKSLRQLVERVRRVLDGVVQQRRAQRRRRHAELGEDRGHGQRVGDVRVAALAPLAGVQPLGEPVRALDGADVGLGVGGPDDREQRLERRVRSRGRGCRAGPAGCASGSAPTAPRPGPASRPSARGGAAWTRAGSRRSSHAAPRRAAPCRQLAGPASRRRGRVDLDVDGRVVSHAPLPP